MFDELIVQELSDELASKLVGGNGDDLDVDNGDDGDDPDMDDGDT